MCEYGAKIRKILTPFLAQKVALQDSGKIKFYIYSGYFYEYEIIFQNGQYSEGALESQHGPASLLLAGVLMDAFMLAWKGCRLYGGDGKDLGSNFSKLDVPTS